MNWLNEVLQSDPDPAETQEWIEALKAVIDNEGPQRAHQLLEDLVELTRRSGAYLPFSLTTEYVNTIPPALEAKSPGDSAMEWKIRSIIRWNAMAMVVRANRKPGDLGGHIASFASAATLYDVGFNHFWRARRTSTRATCSTSRAIAPRASTPAPSWRGGSAKTSWTTSAWKSMARACRPIRTRG